MRRRRVAALAAGRHRPGPHAVAELHHGHEAVSGRAIELPGAPPGTRRERGERAPPRRGEPDGEAGRRIAERLDEIAGEALEPVEVAPRRLPGAEAGRERAGR